MNFFHFDCFSTQTSDLSREFAAAKENASIIKELSTDGSLLFLDE